MEYKRNVIKVRQLNLHYLSTCVNNFGNKISIMSKKHGQSSLGRVLIKDRFGGSKQRRYVANNTMLHTTEVQDGYDWGRLNLQSVTEQSTFHDFLSTAELAGTEFQAEKLNIKFVNPQSNVGLLTEDETNQAKEEFDKHREFIKIPRRPAWDETTTAEELQSKEREAFLEWRRTLASLQEDKGLLLTPYEKNLEFWRQLWRVVERSDVVVQIVDARNPLLFRCEDLEEYVKEVSPNKMNVILANKADFLTEEQRQHWCDYFTSINMQIAFFSAKIAAEMHKINEEDESDNEAAADESENESEAEDVKAAEEIQEKIESLSETVDNIAEKLNEITETLDKCEIPLTSSAHITHNSSKLLSREELIDYFSKIYEGPQVSDNITTIGLVGYPNVGKSSTINALMTVKKVSVSATPGKTKHFQTLYLNQDLMLCDCPGLVMPSFVYTKAEMVVNGILPIDQMRDHVPPVNLVSSLIPRHVIEDQYGIMLPLPIEGEDPTRPPTSEELLNAHAYNRGFMTANGQPDNARAARYLLKDYINGKLLYVHAPPNIEQTVFLTWPERRKMVSENHVQPAKQYRASKPIHATTEDVDKQFFNGKQSGSNIQGVYTGVPNQTQSGNKYKNLKQEGKQKNKKKREKLRRIYSHLDQH